LGTVSIFLKTLSSAPAWVTIQHVAKFGEDWLNDLGD